MQPHSDYINNIVSFIVNFNNMKATLLFTFSFFVLLQCSVKGQDRKKNYAYSFMSKGIVNGKVVEALELGSYISYNGYLFQFKILENASSFISINEDGN